MEDRSPAHRFSWDHLRNEDGVLSRMVQPPFCMSITRLISIFAVLKGLSNNYMPGRIPEASVFEWLEGKPPLGTSFWAEILHFLEISTLSGRSISKHPLRVWVHQGPLAFGQIPRHEVHRPCLLNGSFHLLFHYLYIGC